MKKLLFFSTISILLFSACNQTESDFESFENPQTINIPQPKEIEFDVGDTKTDYHEFILEGFEIIMDEEINFTPTKNARVVMYERSGRTEIIVVEPKADQYTIVKKDRVGTSKNYFDKVQITNLGDSGNEGLFVPKYLDEELKYYVFAYNGNEYEDLSIHKGYLNQDLYITKEEKANEQCVFKLFYVNEENDVINEYYNSLCDEYHENPDRLVHLTQTYKNGQYNVSKVAEYDYAKFDNKGYELKEGYLYKDGIKILDEKIVDSLNGGEENLLIRIFNVINYQNKDYVFFENSRECGGCNWLTSAYVLVNADGSAELNKRDFDSKDMTPIYLSPDGLKIIWEDAAYNKETYEYTFLNIKVYNLITDEEITLYSEPYDEESYSYAFCRKLCSYCTFWLGNDKFYARLLEPQIYEVDI